MPELSDGAIRELVKLGQLAAGPQQVPGGNVPFVLVPDGSKIQAVPELLYNEHAERPERVKASVNASDPESFIEYWRLFADEESRAFADEASISVTAILDYHQQTLAGPAPRWGQHRLKLQLRPSEEWNVWFGSNNKQMTQMGFAEFLEQNSIDISQPAPATMMEIARDLQATTEAEFGAGVRTQDGQVRFRYSETIKASVGSGQLGVPEKFALEIPVFIGGSDILMEALFRFRVKEGKLSLWYTLVRPEEARRGAFLDARNLIAEKLSITIINGSV